MPSIKEILRVPKEDPVPLGANRRKKSRARSMSKAKSVDPESFVFNPEEGWDDQTDPSGVVIDWDEGIEIQRRTSRFTILSFVEWRALMGCDGTVGLACTAKMITPRPALNEEFLFQKVFGDGDFIAAGQLIIPAGKQKPTKGTKDNTFVSLHGFSP